MDEFYLFIIQAGLEKPEHISNPLSWWNGTKDRLCIQQKIRTFLDKSSHVNQMSISGRVPPYSIFRPLNPDHIWKKGWKDCAHLI